LFIGEDHEVFSICYAECLVFLKKTNIALELAVKYAKNKPFSILLLSKIIKALMVTGQINSIYSCDDIELAISVMNHYNDLSVDEFSKSIKSYYACVYMLIESSVSIVINDDVKTELGDHLIHLIYSMPAYSELFIGENYNFKKYHQELLYTISLHPDFHVIAEGLINKMILNDFFSLERDMVFLNTIKSNLSVHKFNENSVNILYDILLKYEELASSHK
jgi:hypothetical protein